MRPSQRSLGSGKLSCGSQRKSNAYVFRIPKEGQNLEPMVEDIRKCPRKKRGSDKKVQCPG